MLIIDGNAVYEVDPDCIRKKNLDPNVLYRNRTQPEDSRYSDFRTRRTEGVYREQYTGKNIGIAVLDTGIFPHPDFGNRIVGFFDAVYGKEEPYDKNGHGTHVADFAWRQ